VAWAEAYLRTKWHPNPSNRVAAIDMGRKMGAAMPPFFWGGGARSDLTQGGLGRGLPPYQMAS